MNVMEKFSLKGKTAIVTGAAMGLGKAMALALAEVGANIVIADINKEVAEVTAKEIEALGVKTMVRKSDVTSQEDVKALVEDVVSEFGRIDVLVNNAGIARHTPVEDMSMKDWNDVMNINVNGVFIMSQEVGKQMIKQTSGSIINISSMSGIIVNTPQFQSGYNTSKAAVIMLTKSLATEWAPYGIRVNTIAPGYMKTDLTKKFFESEENKDLVDRWMSMSPMNRPGEPEELEGIVVYLATNASTFTTGGVFVVDGGYTAW